MDKSGGADESAAMRTVILTEPMADEGVGLLRERPDIRLVIAAPGTDAFAAALPLAEAIGVRVCRLPAAILAQAPLLRVVAKHGVGFDNVDFAYLAGRGIPMAIAAEANAVSVAEHTLMLMLAAAKHLRLYEDAVRQGRWSDRSSARAVDLRGRTVLVVGHGRVGRRVAALCRAFGMAVLVHDVAPPPPADDIETVPSLDAALPRADVVTLHIPLAADTAGLFDAARLARMKPGAVLVNCARGGIVDEAALAAALQSGALAAAGLDVFDDEPPDPANPLLHLANVVATPHSAATTAEGARRMAVSVAENILAAFAGTLPPSVVVNGVA